LLLRLGDHLDVFLGTDRRAAAAAFAILQIAAEGVLVNARDDPFRTDVNAHAAGDAVLSQELRLDLCAP